jgi:hypothetical protein
MPKTKPRKRGPRIEADHNVFISWSGDRSKGAAEGLREWLPIILQAARPWMSDTDIEKGSVGLDEVARALGMKVGIICLTPENQKAEWILFESGALSKAFDDRTRVCTYLLGGLHKQDVKPPLGMFQATTAEKEETRKLVHTINRHLDADPVPEAGLNSLFDKMWPELEGKLAVLPKPSGVAPPKRPPEEMLAEILELTRAMTPQILGLARDAELERRTKQFMTTWRQFAPGATMVKLSDLSGEPLVPAAGTTPAERALQAEQKERARLIQQIRSKKKPSE